MQKHAIIMIAITGGPCGGKSTFLARVHGWLQKYGIKALVVSETATELFNAGVGFDFLDGETFQKELMRYQLGREETYLAIGRIIAEKRPVVILCDRGIMDVAAYVDKSIFLKVLNELGISIKSAMERYKLVVHLMTAAQGAEEFYTLANNAARSESSQLAREIDGKTQQAWLGHPHHVIIDNQTGFDAKMLRALQSLARVLNMPEPTEIERKFEVLNFDASLLPLETVFLDITQNYLISKAGTQERRVRISELDGEKTYYYTEKKQTGQKGVRFEKEEIITPERYAELLTESDPNLLTIRKRRACFVYAGRKLELDDYAEPVSKKGMAILEVELPKIDEAVEFPAWMELREVTGIREFDNRIIAEAE